jgi:hypothetical protein
MPPSEPERFVGHWEAFLSAEGAFRRAVEAWEEVF